MAEYDDDLSQDMSAEDILRTLGMDEDQEAGELKPVSLSELRLVRDKDDNIEPLDVITPIEATPVRIRPMTLGDRYRYKLKVNDEADLSNVSLGIKHKIIINHVVEPDFSGVTQQELQTDFGWSTVDDLCTAVIMYSRDVFRRPALKLKQKRKGADEGKADEGSEEPTQT